MTANTTPRASSKSKQSTKHDPIPGSASPLSPPLQDHEVGQIADLAAPPDSPTCAAALAYAALGWHVFPCGANKKPRIAKNDGGNGYLDATTDAAVIRAWWRKFPDAQIGAACGASRLVAADLDLNPAEKLNGIAVFEQLLGTNRGRDEQQVLDVRLAADSGPLRPRAAANPAASERHFGEGAAS